MPRYYPIAWLLYIVLGAGILALIVSVSSRRARRNKARRAALEARRREYLRRMQREEYLRKHPEARQKLKSSATSSKKSSGKNPAPSDKNKRQ